MIPERRQVKALAEHLLGRAKRDDVVVSVAYVLNFRLNGDDISINVLVDPTENYSRPMMKKMVEGVLSQLNSAETQRDLLEGAEPPPGGQSSADAGPTQDQTVGSPDQSSTSEAFGPGTPSSPNLPVAL